MRSATSIWRFVLQLANSGERFVHRKRVPEGPMRGRALTGLVLSTRNYNLSPWSGWYSTAKLAFLDGT
jgi:hypothetical protein